VNPDDVPGRETDLAWLHDRTQAMMSSGRGEVLFVSGDPGSGRTALLDRYHDELADRHRGLTVLGGEFHDGRYVAFQTEPLVPRVQRLLKKLETMFELAGVAGGVSPIVSLLAQATSRSAAFLTLMEERMDDPAPPDLNRFLGRVLRRLCEPGPVVCVVDNADGAGIDWWADLLLLSGQIAHDLPLVLVLGVAGPAELGPHRQDETDMLFAARRLSRDGSGRWHALSLITRDDLRRWIGVATPELLDEVLAISGGRAGYAHDLWTDWARRGAIERRTDGSWRLSSERERAIDAVSEQLEARLKSACGRDLHELTRMRAALACAALEGRRFTVDAVATALGRQPYELFDLFDRRLGQVVERDGRAQRAPVMYRFTSALDWLTLRHHGFTPEAQGRYAKRMVHGLVRTYDAREAVAIAPQIARLCRLGGDEDAARRFERMGDARVSRAVTLWRARTAAAVELDADAVDRSRAVRHLVEASMMLVPGGPFDDGLVFAHTARRLGPEREDLAWALFCSGSHRRHAGDPTRARDELERALELATEFVVDGLRSSCLHGLSLIDFHAGDYDAARARCLVLRDHARQRSSRQGEAAARHLLAQIEHRRGNLAAARSEFMRVLVIYRKIADAAGEARTMLALAEVHMAQRDHDAAERVGLAALGLSRQTGEVQGEVTAGLLLGRIADGRNEDEVARARLQATRDLAQQIGSHVDELRARRLLAGLDVHGGMCQAATAELRAVAEWAQRAGERQLEADVTSDLARVDLAHHRLDAARNRLLKAQSIYRTMGDDVGEVSVRHHLARLMIEEGDHEGARPELLSVLQTFRERDDPLGEAATRHLLGSVHAARGDARGAMEEWDAALSLYQAMGHRDEAAVRSSMARASR
jgi:tetratricopeptide (TPR) repeat protein